MNVMLDWVRLLLCIQEVLGPNLSPETNYPQWLPVVYPNHTRQIPQQDFILGQQHFLQVNHPFTPLHMTLYSP